DLEDLPEAADRVAHDGDVLCASGKGDLEVWRLGLDAMRGLDLGHAVAGCPGAAWVSALLVIDRPRLRLPMRAPSVATGRIRPRAVLLPRDGRCLTTSGRLLGVPTLMWGRSSHRAGAGVRRLSLMRVCGGSSVPHVGL